MATDLLGNNLKIGDWVAQIRQEYNKSNLSAECGIITEITEDGKIQITSVYAEPQVARSFYDTEEHWKQAVEKQKKNGYVNFFRRKCGTDKVILTYPDKEQVKNIKKYEKASGIKLIAKV